MVFLLAKNVKIFNENQTQLFYKLMILNRQFFLQQVKNNGLTDV